MSDIDPTPGTPVTLGDRLAWLRGDVVGNLAAQLAELGALRAAPANSLAQLAALLGALRGPNNATLSSLLTDAQFDAAIILTNGFLADIKDELITLNDRVDKVQAVLGAEPYSSTETANIRALLISMLAGQGNIGILPDNPSGAIVGSATITQNGRRYVVWNSDITGLTRSNNNISLSAINSWSGYAVYVQSSADTFQAGGAEEWPTNSWLEPPLTGTVEISVSSQYAVRAYMRVPEPGYLFTTAYADSVWYVVTDLSPLPTVVGSPSVSTQNLLGWTAKHISGTVNLRFKPVSSDTPYVMLLPGQTITLPATDNWQAGSKNPPDGSGATTFRLIPPAQQIG